MYEYIPGNKWTGGWGQFSLGRLTLNGVDFPSKGLWHSFGTLGIATGAAPSTTDYNTKSFVKNFQKGGGKSSGFLYAPRETGSGTADALR